MYAFPARRVLILLQPLSTMVIDAYAAVYAFGFALEYVMNLPAAYVFL